MIRSALWSAIFLVSVTVSSWVYVMVLHDRISSGLEAAGWVTLVGLCGAFAQDFSRFLAGDE